MIRFGRVVVLVFLGSILLSRGYADQRPDLLDLRQGAVILAHTGQYSDDYPANAMIDGTTDYFWASAQRYLPGFRPDSLIIELDRRYRIDTLAVDNRGEDDGEYPGVAAREVRFSASVVSPTGPWTTMTTVVGEPGERVEQVLETPVAARWIRVEILSNHGNPNYTELAEVEARGVPLENDRLAAEPLVDGIYQTDYGPLLLQTRGDLVEGCYELDDGYVHGTRQGRTLYLDWIEHRGEQRGTAVLVVSDQGFMNGLWYYQGELQGSWFGNRLSEKASIECDPLTAAAEVGFKTGKLAGK